MAGFRAAFLFLLGTLTGLGAALLLFVAQRHNSNFPLLYVRSTNAFLLGIWFITGGALGSVAAARCGKSLRLRSILAATALIAVLLDVNVEVRRRSREYWALSLQHRFQATVTSAEYQRARLDPRVSKKQLTGLLTHARWHRDLGGIYDHATYVPWLALPALVPCGCPSCAAPGDAQGRRKGDILIRRGRQTQRGHSYSSRSTRSSGKT
jgi:hypothetical protein